MERMKCSWQIRDVVSAQYIIYIMEVGVLLRELLTAGKTFQGVGLLVAWGWGALPGGIKARA